MTRLKYSLSRTVDPTVEPVSLTDAKRHLRLSESDDDQLITDLITVARLQVEHDTRRSLLTQTWQLTLDNWPGRIELPNGPTQSVTSITYVDTDGATQTWDSSNYDLHNNSQHAFIVEAYSKSYPAIRGDERGVTVTYVTGYGAAATSVPKDIRQAVLLRTEMEYDGYTDELLAAYDRIGQAAYAGGYP